MLCLCNSFARVHSSCSWGMSCFILMSRKGPAGAGRKGEDGGGKCCSSIIVGRGRREPVGGEDGVNVCCSL